MIKLDDLKKQIAKAIKKAKEEEIMTTKKVIKLAVVIIGAVVVLAMLFSSFRTVKAGYVGIVTRFGKVSRIADSGLTLKLPLIEKVVKMDTRIQKQEIESGAATKDLQDVTGNIALNYSINKETVLDIYNNLGVDYAESIIAPVLHESFKASVSQFTAEDLIKNRTEAKEKTLESVKGRLAVYGIQVADLNIVNLDFSSAFNAAIEAKAVAQQDVETAKQELERAKVEAEKVKTEAQAQAEAQKAQRETLDELIIKKMWIEKWDGQLPQYATGDSSFIIDMSN